MAAGDHVRVKRCGFDHHGVDLGNGRILNFCGEPFRREAARVIIQPQADFARGNAIEVVAQAGRHGRKIAARLRACRPEAGEYNVLLNNCESFADRAVGGSGRSLQAEAGSILIAMAGVGVAAAVVDGVRTGKWGDAAVGAGSAVLQSGAAHATGRMIQAGGTALVNRTAGRVLPACGRVFARSNFATATALVLVDGAVNTVQFMRGGIDGSEFRLRTAESVSSAAGGLGGAALGAAMGSVVPVVGTAVGGVIGGIIGSFFGGSLFRR